MSLHLIIPKRIKNNYLATMIPHISNGLPNSPFYRKAMEIFIISRSISTYLSHDICSLNNQGQEDSNIYFTGDIVQQSVSLAPKILKAENEAYSEEKHKHADSLNHLVNALDKNCERLERVNSNGKDFLPLLRNELKKFRILQRNWMLTL